MHHSEFMSRPVYILDYSIISSLGISNASNLEALRVGTTGIKTQTISHDSLLLPYGAVSLSNASLGNLLEQENISLPHPIDQFPRAILLHLWALRSIKQWFDLTEPIKTAHISANTVGGIDKTSQSLGTSAPSLKYHEAGKITTQALSVWGLEHIKHTTVSTACSSSANSIIMGSQLIEQGHCDLVIAGGVDALTSYTINGFNALKILDDQLCKPFDQQRAGLNLGEGAGFLVLISEELLSKHRLKAKAILRGYGNANDAFHQTASSPNGEGNYLAIKKALDKACLNMNNIQYINAHGTGTINNDHSENQAISRHIKNKKNLPFLSSTKTFTGHTLGAAGAIEAIFSVMALENQLLWGQGAPILPEEDAQFLWVPNTTSHPIQNVLSNSFGFGGNCSTLLISKI